MEENETQNKIYETNTTKHNTHTLTSIIYIYGDIFKCIKQITLCSKCNLYVNKPGVPIWNDVYYRVFLCILKQWLLCQCDNKAKLQWMSAVFVDKINNIVEKCKLDEICHWKNIIYQIVILLIMVWIHKCDMYLNIKSFQLMLVGVYFLMIKCIRWWNAI